ncbi:MAG: IS66 family insertion sequence element accessory protein TnpB [Smithella sp.]
MLGDLSNLEHIYIACGYTDMRKSIDGLAALVQQRFQMDPFSRSLFLFCGRRRDRIKALFWEENGFVLLYKRLENAAFQWPKTEAEVQELTAQQFRWLMEGLSVEQPKAHRKVAPGRMI